MGNYPLPVGTHWPEATIFTIGHSTLPIHQFIATLKTYGIERLVDIRTIPRSRRNPQFESSALANSLRSDGIQYVHLSGLGGLRHPRKDSPNTGWRNENFRGYADYMQTQAFENELETLINLSRESRLAIMCAEAVPWRCHRSLVSDALIARGITVIDILTESSYRPHKLTAFAHVNGTQITYPPDQAKLL